MRKHGWQPPYHPRQVVAVTVFLALGFAFYVLFAPFVGKKKMHQYIVMGVYTPIVFKYSTHYRACDKCVDGFDHHCKWLNNCIGKRNYKKFFMLMVSAIVLFIVQWSTGIIILIRCAIEHKRFTSEIASKLGNRFTLACYVVVMAGCMILAMIAMLLVGVLFYFHVLLIKKGISTYDYIIALREQDREKEEQEHPQSPQMSLAASTFGQGVVEDQDDVVPPESNSVGKRTVKISPWALARLNAEDVSRAAAEARKKSKILHPVSRKMGSNKLERDSSSDIHPRMASSGAGDAPVSDPLTEIDG